MESSRDPLVVARFWAKVNVGRPGVCWPWQAATHDFGYGVFRPQPEVLVKAHRFAWAVVHGALADDEVLRHKCDNPPCVNPHHLIPGTQADNIADMHSRGRRKYRSRLTAADIADARKQYAAGATQTSIAAHYGVAQSYISMLLSGHRGRAISKGTK